MTNTVASRILCVEDDRDISGYVCEMLKIAGYQTVTATNLIEGLRLAKSERFDLILLDYNLPDGTGLDLCKLIRVLDKHTPILFFSNITEPELRQAAIAAGSQGYIDKMEAFDILEQTITKLIESGGVKSSIDTTSPVEVTASLFSQPDFDRFVERYNANYHFLLLRISSGQFDCLVTSFLVLKDLYTAIIKLHEVGRFELHIVPYPISLRASEAFLAELGFNQSEIELVDSFLKHVKEKEGKEFEEILDEGVMIYCPKKSDPVHPSV
jgi:DNA-binding response OmpR family regulator